MKSRFFLRGFLGHKRGQRALVSVFPMALADDPWLKVFGFPDFAHSECKDVMERPICWGLPLLAYEYTLVDAVNKGGHFKQH